MPTAKTNGNTNSTAKHVADMEAFFERAQLAQAPAWRPEVNDVLSGEILGFRIGVHAEYGEHPVLIIKSDRGPVAFYGFHGLVRDRLRELKPKKGDVITIMYGGKREVTKEEEEAGKRPYHRYYIESGAAEATPVLDSFDF